MNAVQTMEAVNRHATTRKDHGSVAVGPVSYYLVMEVDVQVGLKWQGIKGISSYFIPPLERLSIIISIDYTRPAGFNGGPDEYRAASGPVRVTCTATGPGSGPISYQWSSTCRSCPFQTATGSSVARAAVHSGDTGTHTCHATRDGYTANASINFTVVGELKQIMINTTRIYCHIEQASAYVT